MSRRFHPSRRRRALALGIVVALVAARAWYGWRQPARHENLAQGLHAVERVVDGDTLVLAGGARLRLLGIDAPESVKPDHPIEPWGKAATDFTRRFVAAGPVRLEFDRERVDRYGRFLAYVWVEERLLNEELVRAGLARAEPRYRYSSRMKRRFERAQQEAQAQRRGIWEDARQGHKATRGQGDRRYEDNSDLGSHPTLHAPRLFLPQSCFLLSSFRPTLHPPPATCYNPLASTNRFGAGGQAAMSGMF